MDPVANTDNTNVNPPTDGAVNDAGTPAAIPPVEETPAPDAVVPEPVAPAPVDEGANIIAPTEPTPASPISGMSAPISEDTSVEPVPLDLPPVAPAPEAPEVAATPENIPVEPAPTDTSTPDANQQLGSF
jgi:hypothetical protein